MTDSGPTAAWDGILTGVSSPRAGTPQPPIAVQRRRRLVSTVATVLAVFLAVFGSPAIGVAQAQTDSGDRETRAQQPSETQPAGVPTPQVDRFGTEQASVPASPTDDLTTLTDPPPSPAQDSPTAPAATTPAPTDADETEAETGRSGGGVAPSVRRSTIPVATVALAIGVLAAVALAAAGFSRRRSPGAQAAGAHDLPSTTPIVTPAASAPADGREGLRDRADDGDLADGRDAPSDRELVGFLLEMGDALLDAGDPVNSVAVTLQSLASSYGLAGVGVIALPTALMVSIPGRQNVQTDVTATGTGQLRLDQVEAVLGIVDLALEGRIEPGQGRRELARVRASKSPVPTHLALMGEVVAAMGLALLLRGGMLEIALAGALGATVAALRVVVTPRRANLRPFLPLVSSFVVATTVFLVARAVPGLAALPPLIAPLIPLLPGAMLTMGTLELATGHSLAGVARLGSGGLQLVLLAGGILGAVQFVGVPASTDVVAEASGTVSGGGLDVLLPWLGVAAFGLGIALARGARTSSVRWILLVLFVAYAGQVLGGFFFGDSLSAFFGALAMTPVAAYASRQPGGPPSLVTFLPAFWLLVPGALGLQGVTRILREGGVQGLSTLATTGAAMIGIALGTLLGLLYAAPDRWRLRDRVPRLPGDPGRGTSRSAGGDAE